ncbi:MAG: Stf0 family sulfotransferase, partial [Rhodobacteraceae bacterium]|nr:Stf0 family sulfotransferase [Paracoccaceae bacterium]
MRKAGDRRLLLNQRFDVEDAHALFADKIVEAGIRRIDATLITGRCGSTYLSHLCRQLGFGWGEEPFNEDRAEWHADEYIANDFGDYLRWAIGYSRLGDGFYFQITPLRFQVFADMLGGLDRLRSEISHISILFRKDILAQALSFQAAVTSGLWHSTEPRRHEGEAVFDEKAVLEWIAWIVEMEEAALALRPDETEIFFYEDLLAHPADFVKRFLATHGIDRSQEEIEAALGMDQGPKKLAGRFTCDARGQMLTAHPSLADILERRLAGDLAHALIHQRLDAIATDTDGDGDKGEQTGGEDVPVQEADQPGDGDACPGQ